MLKIKVEVIPQQADVA